MACGIRCRASIWRPRNRVLESIWFCHACLRRGQQALSPACLSGAAPPLKGLWCRVVAVLGPDDEEKTERQRSRSSEATPPVAAGGRLVIVICFRLSGIKARGGRRGRPPVSRPNRQRPPGLTSLRSARALGLPIRPRCSGDSIARRSGASAEHLSLLPSKQARERQNGCGLF